MRVLSVIFGILMVIFGILCICTPVITALDLSIFVFILAAAYGIVGIISGIANKYYGIGFVFSIISFVFAIAMLFVPNMFVLTNGIIFSILACWIVIMSIISVVSALQVKSVTDSKMWILQLIFGIIGIFLGIYAFLHPMLFGLTVAWLIGIFVGVLFMETGFSVMFLASCVEVEEEK